MKPVGGRGKIAKGYKSTHIRIPDVLKNRVEQLKEQFFDGSLGYADELIAEDHKLANEYRKSLTSNKQDINSSQKLLTTLEDKLSALELENEQIRLQLEKLKSSEQDLLDQVCKCHSDAFKAVDILKAALKLKSNAGGAIKREIEKALLLIDDI